VPVDKCTVCFFGKNITSIVAAQLQNRTGCIGSRNAEKIAGIQPETIYPNGLGYPPGPIRMRDLAT
jgi:hypothetical protein